MLCQTGIFFALLSKVFLGHPDGENKTTVMGMLLLVMMLLPLFLAFAHAIIDEPVNVLDGPEDGSMLPDVAIKARRAFAKARALARLQKASSAVSSMARAESTEPPTETVPTPAPRREPPQVPRANRCRQSFRVPPLAHREAPLGPSPGAARMQRAYKRVAPALTSGREQQFRPAAWRPDTALNRTPSLHETTHDVSVSDQHELDWKVARRSVHLS